MEKRTQKYDFDFYLKIQQGSLISAKAVLDVVRSVHPFESIVDFGCGHGSWLAAAQSLGASKLRGVDGVWVDPEKMISREIQFSHADFEKPISSVGKFDLAMSAEVAEHISEASALYLVDALCNASDTVLFGAAIPGQVGRHHVNLQWQSWWAAHFRNHGYVAVDAVRPHVWANEQVHWWYRQNLLIYCKRENREAIKAFKALEGQLLDVVHPKLYIVKHELHFAPKMKHVLGAAKNFLISRWGGY